MAARRYIVASVILLLVNAGASWLWEAYLKKEPEAGAVWGNFPVSVDAAPVEVGRVVRSVEAVGTLSANEGILVRPEIDGLLTGYRLPRG